MKATLIATVLATSFFSVARAESVVVNGHLLGLVCNIDAQGNVTDCQAKVSKEISAPIELQAGPEGSQSSSGSGSVAVSDNVFNLQGTVVLSKGVEDGVPFVSLTGDLGSGDERPNRYVVQSAQSDQFSALNRYLIVGAAKQGGAAGTVEIPAFIISFPAANTPVPPPAPALTRANELVHLQKEVVRAMRLQRSF